MKKKIIITGGAGFIGGHLATHLVSLGYNVHIVDSLVSGKREHVPSEVTLHVLDIRDQEKLIPIFQGSDTVFHMAALVSVPYSIENPIETHDVNAFGTLKVLIAARDAGVRRVVFSSSAAVYGDQEDMPVYEHAFCEPNSPYGLQKLESEHYMRLASELYGVETVSLRYFNLYGPRQSATGPYASVIAKFLDQARSGATLTIIGEGDQTRDFVHVEDVVLANISAMDSIVVGKGEALNIGGGVQYSIKNLAQMIGNDMIHLPPRIEIQDSLASIELAKKLLGWSPKKKLEEGIINLKKEYGI